MKSATEPQSVQIRWWWWPARSSASSKRVNSSPPAMRLDDAGRLEDAEVAVHRALGQPVARGHDLGGGQRAVGRGQDPHHRLAVGGVALARRADAVADLEVEVRGAVVATGTAEVLSARPLNTTGSPPTENG